MESAIVMFLSIFTSQFFIILFVILCFVGLISWCVKHVLYKREIHNRLLEIAFERSIMNEKSRIIQH